MCGLVAVVSKSTNGFIGKEKDMFHELLFADTLRGDDSTGMMMVDIDGNLELAKEATTAYDFQRSNGYTSMMQRSFRDGAAMIGHNRKATRGVINDDNAHPFIVDDRIVLMHNGTLWGDHKKIADVEVDSHAIAHSIHNNGDDVEAALRDINGAFALIWYDVQNRTLNFVRNSQRPLCYIETTNSWVWASEGSMLAWIISRNQISLPQEAKIQMLPTDTLHSFKREGRRWVKEEKKLDLTKKTVFTHGYSANDSCSLPTDRHPYACAWYSDDEDDAIIGASPAAEVLQTSAANILLPTPPTRPLRAGPHHMQIKVLPGESKRAMAQGCSMTVPRFEEVRSKYGSASWVTGEIFDFDYVKGDSVTQGIFLYARVVEDPDMMMRCYVAYDPDNERYEYDILELVTTGKKAAFHVLSQGWHKHESGDVTEGFGCYYCDTFSPIVSKVVQVEEISPFGT